MVLGFGTAIKGLAGVRMGVTPVGVPKMARPPPIGGLTGCGVNVDLGTLGILRGWGALFVAKSTGWFWSGKVDVDVVGAGVPIGVGPPPVGVTDVDEVGGLELMIP